MRRKRKGGKERDKNKRRKKQLASVFLNRAINYWTAGARWNSGVGWECVVNGDNDIGGGKQGEKLTHLTRELGTYLRGTRIN